MEPSGRPESCPLSAAGRNHAHHSSPGRARRGHRARRAHVRADERRVGVRPQAGQGRRRLALRPAHRRPGPQRAVRLRRHRPLHRRRPRPRRRRQEADRRQGDHQGRRQERRRRTPPSHPTTYAGATAKAAVLALVRDKNPRTFGGVDLVTQLEGRVATAAPITGRIEDAYDPADPFGGDFANVIGQAYAARALSAGRQSQGRRRHGVPARSSSAPRATSARTSPPTRRAPTSRARARRRPSVAPSTDATALARPRPPGRQGRRRPRPPSRRPSPGSSTTSTQRLVQRTGTSTGTANTNSTGLAGWALGEAGAAEAGGQAARLGSLQVAGDNPCTRRAGQGQPARSPTTSTPTSAGAAAGHHEEGQRPVATSLGPGAARAALGAARRGCVHRDRSA